MAKKETHKYDFYEVSGDSVTRKKKHCPRCGPGVFMAEHDGRLACGKCGYTEYPGKKGSKKDEKTEEENKADKSKKKG